MKLRIKEICKEKGIKMTDVAEKVGVDYSNLVSSLKGNPTLNRLTDVAKALGVSVAELFEKQTESVSLNGYVEIKGDILPIRSCEDWIRASEKIDGLPFVPLYNSLEAFRNDLKNFIYDNVKDLRKESSLWGMIGAHEVFCLSSICQSIEDGDGLFLDDKTFVLSLLRTGETISFDLLEYGTDGDYDLDSPQGLISMIRVEIEKFMESMESATE